MRTRAAVLQDIGRSQPYAASRPLVIEELELDPPGPGEVLVEIKSAGLCHSDLSVINGGGNKVYGSRARGHEHGLPAREKSVPCLRIPPRRSRTTAPRAPRTSTETA